MTRILQKLLPKRLFLFCKEAFGTLLCFGKLIREGAPARAAKPQPHRKPVILFYHLDGLGFGGTEKTLQRIAKYLDKEVFRVVYLFSSQKRDTRGVADFASRKAYLEGSGVELVDFSYAALEPRYPYFIRGMRPGIFETINRVGADLLFGNTAGYTEFPVNVVRNIPVVLYNSFGESAFQGNIVKFLCSSRGVVEKAARYTPRAAKRLEVFYNPVERPPAESAQDGAALRRSLGIPDDHIVFGRIGRADDRIYDPIGILAFEKAVRTQPWLHLVIMAPPPRLAADVRARNIPNVHLLDATGDERKVWAFHQANDVLAHFRWDGETFGINIAEAMLCGKPIVTHVSHEWNAHLEYLDPSFSFVAERDNADQYAGFLMRLGADREKTGIRRMGALAKEKAESLFLMENRIGRIEEILRAALPRYFHQ